MSIAALFGGWLLMTRIGLLARPNGRLRQPSRIRRRTSPNPEDRTATVQATRPDEDGSQGRPAALVTEDAAPAPEALAPVPAPRVEAVLGEGPPGRIRLLNRFGIEGPAGLVTSRSDDLWALLGLLAEHGPDHLLTRDTAVRLLWPDRAPGPSRFTTLLKDTRTKLCDALALPHHAGKHVIQNIDTRGYVVNRGHFAFDVWTLRAHLAAAKADPGHGRSHLEAAVDLYTGPYLPGVRLNWAETAATTLTRQIVHALTELADLEPTAEQAVRHLERATDLDPAAQRLYRRRMELYTELDRPQAVQHCYEQLADQLKARGVRPEQTTVQLHRRLTGD